MKLDVSCMRFLSKEDYRVLEAIEMGMRNHEMVPIPLISSIAKLRHGGLHKFLSTLLRYKLIAHTNNEYNGYRLSYMGYDILALHTLQMKGVISTVGSQIGVGKESDIFEAQDEGGNDLVIKIHRLGRTSFRSVRKNRDYMKGKSKASWLYMSRLAAIKEFAFMQALYAHDFPTPVPIDQNRHVVAMSRVFGFPMAQIKTGRMYGSEQVFKLCISILTRLVQHGLVHCDFNEFNLLLDEDGHVTLIDFPQMVSISHPNAPELFQRDVNCLVKFFAMKMCFIPDKSLLPSFASLTAGLLSSSSSTSPTTIARLDEEVRASGWLSGREEEELLKFIFEREEEDDDENDEGDGRDAEEGGLEDEDEGIPSLVDLSIHSSSLSSPFSSSTPTSEGTPSLIEPTTNPEEEQEAGEGGGVGGGVGGGGMGIGGLPVMTKAFNPNHHLNMSLPRHMRRRWVEDKEEDEDVDVDNHQNDNTREGEDDDEGNDQREEEVRQERERGGKEGGKVIMGGEGSSDEEEDEKGDEAEGERFVQIPGGGKERKGRKVYESEEQISRALRGEKSRQYHQQQTRLKMNSTKKRNKYGKIDRSTRDALN